MVPPPTETILDSRWKVAIEPIGALGLLQQALQWQQEQTGWKALKGMLQVSHALFRLIDLDASGFLDRRECEKFQEIVSSQCSIFDADLFEYDTAGSRRLSEEQLNKFLSNSWRTYGKRQFLAQLSLAAELLRQRMEAAQKDPYLDLKDANSGGGCIIPLTEERGVLRHQLRAIAAFVQKRCRADKWKDPCEQSPTYDAPLDPDAVNLYQLVELVVKPATEARRCSYVELVASGPQRPKWFVSHWWGEPMVDFLACLEQHAADRMLKETDPYWVCAYANNQWDLKSDVFEDPSQSSFRRAMELCEGTVSILDHSATCYKRIWCCYEVWVSISQGGEEDNTPHVRPGSSSTMTLPSWDRSMETSPPNSSRSSKTRLPPIPSFNLRQSTGSTNWDRARVSTPSLPGVVPPTTNNSSSSSNSNLIDNNLNTTNGSSSSSSNSRARRAQTRTRSNSRSGPLDDIVNLDFSRCSTPASIGSGSLEASAPRNSTLTVGGWGKGMLQPDSRRSSNASAATTATYERKSSVKNHSAASAAVTSMPNLSPPQPLPLRERCSSGSSDRRASSIGRELRSSLASLATNSDGRRLSQLSTPASSRRPSVAASVGFGSQGMRDRPYMYDMYTAVGSKAIGITDGCTEVDLQQKFPVSAKTQREKEFPMELCRQALSMKLQEAQATNPMDQRRILNSIAGSRKLDVAPPVEHENYDQLNGKLHGRIASAAWRHALDAGEDMEAYYKALSGSQLPRLELACDNCEVLSDAEVELLSSTFSSVLRWVDLDFSFSPNITTNALKQLSAGIRTAPALRRLALAFIQCGKIGDEGLVALGASTKALEALQELTLSFYGCKELTDVGVLGLLEHLPPKLTSLDLDFSFNQMITEEVLMPLNSASLIRLRKFRLSLHYCTKVLNHRGIAQLAKALPPMLDHLHLDLRSGSLDDDMVVGLVAELPRSLQQLYLELSGNPDLSDRCLKALAAAMPPALETLKLNFSKCTRLTDEGLQALADALPETITSMTLKLTACEAITPQGIRALAAALPNTMRRVSLWLDYCPCVVDARKVMFDRFENASTKVTVHGGFTMPAPVLAQ